MFDVRRLRGPAFTLVALAAMLAAWSAVLRPVLGGRPPWLPGADPASDLVTFQAEARALRSAERGTRPADADGPGSLGVLLGSSTLECAIDPARLGPPSRRWLSLYGGGVNAIDGRRLADVVARSELRPSACVLAINLGTLAASTDYLSDPDRFDAGPLRMHLARRNLFLAKEDLEANLQVPWNRAFPNRTRISHWIRHRLFLAKLDLLGRLTGDPFVAFAPAADPWHPVPFNTGPRPPAGFGDVQMDGWAKKGWFDPSRYSLDGPNVRALVETVADQRSRGVAVVIVLVPEKRRLREAVPPLASALLSEALARAFGPEAPRVIDARGAVEEDDFYDLAHVDPRGREKFTGYLSRRLLVALP
jgi:hypothetical protein